MIASTFFFGAWDSGSWPKFPAIPCPLSAVFATPLLRLESILKMKPEPKHVQCKHCPEPTRLKKPIGPIAIASWLLGALLITRFFFVVGRISDAWVLLIWGFAFVGLGQMVRYVYPSFCTVCLEPVEGEALLDDGP